MGALRRTELVGAHGDTVEMLYAFPAGVDRPKSLLIVHGHQHPGRPGAISALPPERADMLVASGLLAAAVSQPGYGGSSGPPDMCGPRTQAAIRQALAHMMDLGADSARTVVWGISRGAMAAACAFGGEGPEPTLLILQAGTYDLRSWRDWVLSGAPGGDPELARRILHNQTTEAGDTDEALDDRSGVRHAAAGSCDVLLVHGELDPQGPRSDLIAMKRVLEDAGRRVEVAIAKGVEHRVMPSFTLHALARHWPHLALPTSANARRRSRSHL